MNDNEKVMNFVDEIMNVFDTAIEKSTMDMKDYELKKETYKKKLIKIFKSNDKL